ncbi:Bifunctional chorismate mutase/prephenate dehydratase [Methanimicrococcus sp. At1]|uniref:prephenate dehydratase n=1 Tax=Methanimicrococcus hacksteinii TaxID=3028293 RepID=A0ABU3VNL4_9EURY|nr:prephenate dehydratase domain-containing protein [Methanimicrococcus sp. At1]MDV0444801.1 Bifunctional chorismate mutase/prephenate dehydratase [Methanimicrococcus sp. At1]
MIGSVLGPAGSYSEIAARTLFATVCDGKTPELLLCPSLESAVMRLFEADADGQKSDFALVPIENSVEGAVGVSMDLLLEKDVSIVAEMILPVSHCLLVSENAAKDPDFSIDKIDIVFSHPQGLYQCRSFLQAHLKNAELIEVDSTSKAAQRVSELSEICFESNRGIESEINSESESEIDSESESEIDSESESEIRFKNGSADSVIYAAIASENAGREYGLKTVCSGIQDHVNNSTRFLILVRSEVIPLLKAYASDTEFSILPEFLSQTGSGSVFYKTSVVVSPKQDKPGALFHILEAFYNYDINLTRIESRPSKKSLGEYQFYIDFEGSPSDSNVSGALLAVKGRSARLKILGTYGRILPSRQ